MDSTLFPNPKKFDPARWIRAGKSGEEHLGRFLVSFNKGSRQCLGIKWVALLSSSSLAHGQCVNKSSLAYAEIYMTIAHVVRRFDFILSETSADSICVHRETGIGCPETGYFNVKCVISAIVDE